MGFHLKAQKQDAGSSENSTSQLDKISVLSKEKGFSKLKLNCYACHNPNADSHDNLLAPPLAAVKYSYQQNFPDKETFVLKMTDFLMKPTKEKTTMKGPVNRFGLMVKSTLPKKEIQAIARFIFENEMEIPSWFPKHFEEEHGKPWNDR